MKVIIAGSRTARNYSMLLSAIELSGFEITEVVSGKEPKGADALGEKWARSNNIPVKEFPAYWDDLSFPDAIIKVNRYGKEYDARAGKRRNFWMAEYADALIALWNGKSPGTRNMIEHAERRRLQKYVYRIDRDENLDHEAVKLYRETFRLCPNFGYRNDIVLTVKNLDRWKTILGLWKRNGWNPMKVGWLLSEYERTAGKNLKRS